MNNHARKRDKGNGHPADSFAPKFKRKRDTPRQRIQQVLRAPIPLTDMEKLTYQTGRNCHKAEPEEQHHNGTSDE